MGFITERKTGVANAAIGSFPNRDLPGCSAERQGCRSDGELPNPTTPELGETGLVYGAPGP